MNYKRVIVAAACRCGDVVFVGARHYDMHMYSQLKALDPKSATRTMKRSEVVQGFIDNKGNFLTRTEAWKIAEECGQIVRRCGGDEVDGGTLYSENLY